jgi:hypothetical protein
MENSWIADIASVNDVVRSLQRLDRLWPKQTVGVGDYADLDRQRVKSSS